MDLSRSKPMMDMQYGDEVIIRTVQRGRAMINTYCTDPDEWDPDCMSHVQSVEEFGPMPQYGNGTRVRPNIR